MSDNTPQKDEFLKASQAKDSNLIAEFTGFMKENKKWWLAPILIVLLALGTLAMVGGSGVAPFIYSLF
jgi:hypothetical protein